MRTCVVFQTVDLLSLPIALIAVTLRYHCYYLNINFGANAFKISEKWLSTFKILPLPIETKDSLKKLTIYGYGYEKYAYGIAEKLITQEISEVYGKYICGVNNLCEKLQLIIRTSFNTHDLGLLVLGTDIDEFSKRKVWYIHDSIFSFMLRDHGVEEANNAKHFVIPSRDIAVFFSRLFRLFIALTKRLMYVVRILVKSFSKNNFLKNDSKTTANQVKIDKQNSSIKNAIFFHQSIWYGPLFMKDQYFSDKPASLLYHERLCKFVLGKPTDPDLIPETDLDQTMIPISSTLTIEVMLKVFKVFIVCYFGCKSKYNLNSLIGHIMIMRIYLSFLAWRESLSEYRVLQNIIIDYDILFPKALALACESLKVKTIALQERPTLIFASSCGVIVETYLTAGPLFSEKCKANRSISAKNIISFGQWRTSFFKDQRLPELSSIRFLNTGNPYDGHFNNIVTCLGLFSDKSLASKLSPVANLTSCRLFINDIGRLATRFPETAFVIRFKLDISSIIVDIDNNDLLNTVDNLFLCHDYDKPLVSYALCKNADFVIALTTSLADECLAYGLPVIFFDYFHNIKGMAIDIYPDDYAPIIAQDYEYLEELCSKLLIKDQNILDIIQNLRRYYSPSDGFVSKQMIHDALTYIING